MSLLNMIHWNSVVVAALIFLVIVLVLVVVLLLAKNWLVASGEVSISINDGKKIVKANSGKSLLATLADGGVHLSSACGGKGSCGQCKVQVLEGGGRHAPHRGSAFLTQADERPLASRMPGKGEKRYGNRGRSCRSRREGMGMRGDFQPQRSHLHQGIHRQAS